mmetsp:Transcript_36690/g.114570  ORF Transcript_36690/g.114570 Transcript_36690/m.114570 type:complete len:96 (+) Transcript_36690:1562-1849(+)
MDPVTRQNDMFVTGRLVGHEKSRDRATELLQEGMDLEQNVFQDERSTDVHWRAKGGRANFNHRWNFVVQLPAVDMRLVIQVSSHLECHFIKLIAC